MCTFSPTTIQISGGREVHRVKDGMVGRFSNIGFNLISALLISILYVKDEIDGEALVLSEMGSHD